MRWVFILLLFFSPPLSAYEPEYIPLGTLQTVNGVKLMTYDIETFKKVLEIDAEYAFVKSLLKNREDLLEVNAKLIQTMEDVKELQDLQIDVHKQQKELAEAQAEALKDTIGDMKFELRIWQAAFGTTAIASIVVIAIIVLGN